MAGWWPKVVVIEKSNEAAAGLCYAEIRAAEGPFPELCSIFNLGKNRFSTARVPSVDRSTTTMISSVWLNWLQTDVRHSAICLSPLATGIITVVSKRVIMARCS